MHQGSHSYAASGYLARELEGTHTPNDNAGQIRVSLSIRELADWQRTVVELHDLAQRMERGEIMTVDAAEEIRVILKGWEDKEQ